MNLPAVVLAVTLLVTNTNDSGPGSLRDALLKCERTPACTIAFAIPGDGPWHTIRPLSPLPPVPRTTTFDGETQRAAFGDTNPYGPEIELNGSELASGNGLELDCSFVRGLAINGFPSNGVVLGGDCHGFDAVLERNYIGCDPTGMLAVPNVRGVWVDSKSSTGLSYQYFWNVRENLISGNQYSGVFIGAGKALVSKNIIGLNALLNGPLSNGASGVAVMKAGDGSDIGDNYIGFNGHFGVAIAPQTPYVKLYGNSFQANSGLAIDRGLDGVSLAADISAPEITSVRYEDGVTIIEAKAKDLGPFGMVNFYANDAPDDSGYGEGQYFLGAVFQERTGEIVLRYGGDLRGKWVAATKTFRTYTGFARPPAELREQENWQGFFSGTSEFSRAVLVK
jgi:hypothetical protein